MRNAASEKLLSITNSTGMLLSDDAFATHMDEADPLREHRASFIIPKTRDGDVYSYLVGHCLGPQHTGVEAAMSSYLKKWQQQGLEGHVMQPSPWMEMGESIKRDMAALIGASASEVAIMDTCTVNLHLMLTAFYKPTATKRKIMIENQAFPSTTQCVLSQIEAHGGNAVDDCITIAAPDHGEWNSPSAPVPTEVFLSAIERHGAETAVLVLGAVHFMSGQLFDLPAIIKAAHEKGIIVGLDIAHAIGNVPMRLHDWEADFAVWCTYKYLNGGPGNMGALFVHSKHTLPGSQLRYLKGWWGRDRNSRGSLKPTFVPKEGAAAFQISAGSVADLTILGPAVALMAAVGIDALRDKSLHLTAYLELLLSELMPPGVVEVITPVDPAFRGAQLSLRVLPNKIRSSSVDGEGFEVTPGVTDNSNDAAVATRQLMELGVMVDNKTPDILRITPAPLYNNYTDVLIAVRALASLF